MSAQVETVNYTGVYYLPYINYDGAACDEVNKRIEKLAQNYIENTDEYGSGCMGISYKWTLYGDILSLLIPLQFDADMVEYNVYVLDLKKDKLLTKKDLLAELNIDEADYEQDAQDTMDACFYSLYGSFKDTDDYYDVVYNETIASENVAGALPYIDENGKEIIPTEPNSYKFESFIFDAFEFFDDIAILRGKREDDFAPVKNKDGVDSPKTAKELYEKYWNKMKK
jgi:hypothetical protein